MTIGQEKRIGAIFMLGTIAFGAMTALSMLTSVATLVAYVTIGSSALPPISLSALAFTVLFAFIAQVCSVLSTYFDVKSFIRRMR